MARRTTALDSMWEAKTAEGENLIFEKCKGGFYSDKDKYGLKLVGKTEQEKKTGKNLLKPLSMRTTKTTINGIGERSFSGDGIYNSLTYNNYYIENRITTMDITNNILTIEKTDNSIDYGIGLDVNVLPETTYTFSFIEANKIGDAHFGFYDIDGNHLGQYTQGYSFTTPTNCVYVTIILGSTKQATFVYSNLQLEESASPTSYEPYCGGIASPNPDYPEEIQCVKAGTKIKCCGKNLFDKTKSLLQGIQEEAAFSAWGDDVLSETEVSKILKPNTTYTMTFSVRVVAVPTEGQQGAPLCGFSFYNKKLVKHMAVGGYSWTTHMEVGEVKTRSFSFTSPNDISGYQMIVYTQNYTNPRGFATMQFYNIQIEEGNTATEYEPYIGNEITLPVDLYDGDIWYPMSGKVERHMYVNKEYVPSTVKIYSKTSDTYIKANCSIDVYTQANSQRCKCNIVPSGGGISTEKYYMTFQRQNTTTKSIYFSLKYTDLGEELSKNSTNAELSTAFKAFFEKRKAEGNPVEIVLLRASVIKEEIEPLPIFMPSGTVNVLQIPTELAGTMSATVLIRR